MTRTLTDHSMRLYLVSDVHSEVMNTVQRKITGYGKFSGDPSPYRRVFDSIFVRVEDLVHPRYGTTESLRTESYD